MDKYPTISLTELTKIKTILDNIKDDADYLDGRVCPYDDQTRAMLKAMAIHPVAAATIEEVGKPSRKKAGRKKSGGLIDNEELEKEFDELRKEINTLKADAAGLEPHERIQVVKTRATLIEKIIQMKERIGNLKKVDSFIALVIQTMQDEMEEDQQKRLVDIFEEYIERD